MSEIAGNFWSMISFFFSLSHSRKIVSSKVSPRRHVGQWSRGQWSGVLYRNLRAESVYTSQKGFSRACKAIMRSPRRPVRARLAYCFSYILLRTSMLNYKPQIAVKVKLTLTCPRLHIYTRCFYFDVVERLSYTRRDCIGA